MGTKEGVWLGVLLYTGLRRSDAVRIGRQHVRDGIATIRTKKTAVTIPVLPTLAEILHAGPCSDLAFICGERGQPFTKESFGNAFRDACNAAGVKKSAHGVRKIGATRAANNGATVAELEAIFGWEGAGWPRSTPALPIELGWQKARWPSWIERGVNNLFKPPVQKVRELAKKSQ